MLISLIRKLFYRGTVVATSARIRSGWSQGRSDSGFKPTWYKA